MAVLQSGEPMQSWTTLAQTSGIDHYFTALATATGVNAIFIVAAAVAAVFALMILAMMLFGQWMLASTASAFAAAWRAFNGDARSVRTDVRTILGAGSLLALWLAVFGIKVWPFVVWDGVLVIGIAAALWRLQRPARREVFGDEARAELREAATAAGRLSIACFVILGAMLGNTPVAVMAAPWPAVLAITAAGVILGLSLPVERRLRNALTIAQRDRSADPTTNGHS